MKRFEREIIDISMPIYEQMLRYPADTPFCRRLDNETAEDNGAVVSTITLSAHLGTHIDAPSHYFAGAAGIDELDAGVFVGRARVVDCRGYGVITAEVLERVWLGEVERLLIKSDNSRLLAGSGEAGQDGAAYIDESAAQLCAERKLRLVGFDYISVDPVGSEKQIAHRVLLGGGMAILEGIDLSAVEPGEYELSCLPVLLRGCEAAPCRAVLIKTKGQSEPGGKQC
ncbi:MAG: cyclase family protein [Sedimentisphaerales bacterium]|nr:cyclase family protein [Sedimentisphaerales bacterium]